MPLGNRFIKEWYSCDIFHLVCHVSQIQLFICLKMADVRASRGSLQYELTLCHTKIKLWSDTGPAKQENSFLALYSSLR